MGNRESRPSRLKPYSFLFHPYKSWLDIGISLLLYLAFPLRKLTKLPARKDYETCSKQKYYRDMLKMGAVGEGKSIVAKWEKSAGCPIVECRYELAHRALLKEWGLSEDERGDSRPSGNIPVVIRFPASVHPGLQDMEYADKNEFGCLTVDKLDLKEFDAKVPIVLSFHGGGLTLGVADMGDCLEATQKVCEESSKDVVYASVEYSLAPEFPFPVAVEESLTVASHFLEVLPKKQLHLQGVSAGAYLASILTMELHRRHPGRIASSLILCPMVNPAADSKSYYMQSQSTYISSSWLRWCWRCYLQLDEPTIDEDDDVLKKGSNSTLWADWQSKNGTTLARLVSPFADLPKGLDSETAPKIIILTNQGDPLEDDGVLLATTLTSAGAKVEHLNHGGSHWFGTKLDKDNYASLITAWKRVLFYESE